MRRAGGVELLPAEGGWGAILRLRGHDSGATDEDALVSALLEGPGVIAAPGWLFDLEPADEEGRPVSHLVISLLPEPELLEAGLAHVIAAVANASR